MNIEGENEELYQKPYSVIDYQLPGKVHLLIDQQLVKLCSEEFKVVESKEDK